MQRYRVRALTLQSPPLLTEGFMFWHPQDENASASLADVAATVRGQATIALEIIALAAMLPFLYIEAATIVEYGKSWLVTQNIIDALTYINQVCSCHNFRTVQRASLGICCLVCRTDMLGVPHLVGDLAARPQPECRSKYRTTFYISYELRA